MKAAGEEKLCSGAINCHKGAKRAIEVFSLSYSPVRISHGGAIMAINEGFNQPYSHQLKSIKSFRFAVWILQDFDWTLGPMWVQIGTFERVSFECRGWGGSSVHFEVAQTSFLWNPQRRVVHPVLEANNKTRQSVSTFHQLTSEV